MKWVNDWPVIGDDKDGDGKGEPVLVYKKPKVGKIFPVTTPAESDEFNSDHLGLQWQWQANPQKSWASPNSSGTLRMFPVYQRRVNNLWNLPNILAQKLPAEEFTATLKVLFKPKQKNESFGLLIFGSDYAYISLLKGEDGVYIICNENSNADKGNREIEGATFPGKRKQFLPAYKSRERRHL
jgi:beta-xylosidase